MNKQNLKRAKELDSLIEHNEEEVVRLEFVTPQKTIYLNVSDNGGSITVNDGDKDAIMAIMITSRKRRLAELQAEFDSL